MFEKDTGNMTDYRNINGGRFSRSSTPVSLRGGMSSTFYQQSSPKRPIIDFRSSSPSLSVKESRDAASSFNFELNKRDGIDARERKQIGLKDTNATLYSSTNGMPRSQKVPTSIDMSDILDKAMSKADLHNNSNGRFSRSSTPVSLRGGVSPSIHQQSSSRGPLNDIRSSIPSRGIGEPRDAVSSFDPDPSKRYGIDVRESKQMGSEGMDPTLYSSAQGMRISQKVPLSAEMKHVLDKATKSTSDFSNTIEGRINSSSIPISLRGDVPTSLHQQNNPRRQINDIRSSSPSLRIGEFRDVTSSFDFESYKRDGIDAEESKQIGSEEMDSVLVRRYLEEKKNRKTLEDNNLNLKSDIDEMRNFVEAKIAEAESNEAAAAMKMNEKETMIDALHDTIKTLQDQLTNEAIQTENRNMTVREDTNRQIVSIRANATEKITSVRDELAEVKTKYDTTQKELDTEVGKSSDLSRKLKAMERLHESRRMFLMEEKDKFLALDKKYNEQEKLLSSTKDSSKEEIRKVSAELSELKDKFELEKTKAKDFSSQLKVVSRQFFTSEEKLEELRKKEESLSKELGGKEQLLKKETEKQISNSKQLEQMAKGYVDLNTSFKTQKESNGTLTETVTNLRAQLSAFEEVDLKNEELEKIIMEKEGKVESLSCELEETKREASIFSENISLSELKVEEIKKSRDLLTDEINTTKEQLEEVQEKCQGLTNTFNNTNADLQQVQLTLEKEKEENKEKLNDAQNKMADMESDAEKMKKQYRDLFDSLVETEEKLKTSDDKFDSLEKIVEGKESEIRLMSLRDSQNLQANKEEVEKLKENQQKSKGLYSQVQDLECALEKTIATKNQIINDGEEHLTVIRKQLTELKEMYAIKTQDLSTVEDQLVEVQEKCQGLTNKFNNTNTDLRQVKSMLEKEKEENKEKLSEAHNKISNMESDAEKMKKQYRDLFDSLAEIKEELKKSQDKIGTLEKIIDGKDNEIRLMSLRDSQNLQTNQKDLEKERLIVQELQSALEKTGAKNYHIDGEDHLTVRKELTELREMYTTKTQDLSTTQDQLKKQQETYEGLENKFNNTNTELQEVKRMLEKEENKEKVNEEHSKMTDMKSNADKMGKQNIDFFETLVETEEKLEKSQDKIGSLEKLIEDKEKEIQEKLEKTLDKIRSLENIIEDKEKEIRLIKLRFSRQLNVNTEDFEKELEKDLSMVKKLEEAQQKSEGLYYQLAEAEEEIVKKIEETAKIQKEMEEKRVECNELKGMLEKEKKGVSHRKLKVAKKMIHAEKERQKLLVTEMDAKDVMLSRVQKQAETLESQLVATRKLLESEKEKMPQDSSHTVQELRIQLDEELEKAKVEKEELTARVKAEEYKVQVYADRLKKKDDEAIPKTSTQQEELNKRVKILEKQNSELEEIVKETRASEEAVTSHLTEIEGKFKAVTTSMDSLTKYCSDLEEEKKKMQKDLTVLRKVGPDVENMKTKEDNKLKTVTDSVTIEPDMANLKTKEDSLNIEPSKCSDDENGETSSFNSFFSDFPSRIGVKDSFVKINESEENMEVFFESKVKAVTDSTANNTGSNVAILKTEEDQLTSQSFNSKESQLTSESSNSKEDQLTSESSNFSDDESTKTSSLNSLNSSDFPNRIGENGAYVKINENEENMEIEFVLG